ncbi:Coiled-coil and C2 domain-containing protein 1-like [Hypsibius exemplaris]|uniref:Coiled-coil and C2 domain-containing protein 1-like n=1 Tax=Hypsibius exemplaris TaxID=2072580 RepID=A0A1W0XF02_HYPEX|nr:Coiled-coil and C2 domain-containing protein 1-like [Hypsibius exemplaris]
MDRKGRNSEGGSTKPRASRPSLPFPMQMPGMEIDEGDDVSDDDVADEDLEAELDALMNGTAPARKAAPPRRKPSQQSAVAPPRKAAAAGAKKEKPSNGGIAFAPPRGSGMMVFDLSAIERMGQEDDDDKDIDEDDPELLAELQQLSPDVPIEATPSFQPKSHAPTAASSGGSPDSTMLAMLQERLENYEGAHQDAVYEKESAKARRYERSIKTIKEQITQWKKGQPVEEEDVPPPVFIKSVLQKTISIETKAPQPPPVPARVIPPEPTNSLPVSPSREQIKQPAPFPASPATRPIPVPVSAGQLEKADQSSVVSALKARREQYVQACVKANKEGNKAHAYQFMKICKEFKVVIEAAEGGQEIDLSEIPPPPDQLPADFFETALVTGNTVTQVDNKSPSTSEKTPPAKLAQSADDDGPEIDPSDVKAAFNAPHAPKTVLEALQQRLEKYKSTHEEAKTAGDSSKARRMQRIVQQYQQAIKDYQGKRHVDFAELPTPPGFGPIPIGGPRASNSAGGLSQSPASRPAVMGSGGAIQAPARSSIGSMGAGHSSRESRQVQQYNLLQEREKQFKMAAVKAKQEGDLETAKMYLRQIKGLEPMLKASANGLPVDVASLPKPPPGMGHDTDDYDVVQYEEAGALPGSSVKNRTEAYSQLEKDLVDQVAMCVRNESHFKKAGDIPMARKFERFNRDSRKDLDSLRSAYKNSASVPRFHYETRAFTVIKCCPELPDNVMELSVIRGLGYSLTGFAPTDFVTYVKWDFPFPTEAPQTSKTMAFKGTNEPDYSTTFTIKIDRKARSLARVFKTKGIKCEVYVKMGFLKADKVLGTVNISLETLETKCIHHTSIDLMEGKKAVGGKLEVRVRIREPLLKQQVEELREKWLVIDQFVK